MIEKLKLLIEQKLYILSTEIAEIVDIGHGLSTDPTTLLGQLNRLNKSRHIVKEAIKLNYALARIGGDVLGSMTMDTKAELWRMLFKSEAKIKAAKICIGLSKTVASDRAISVATSAIKVLNVGDIPLYIELVKCPAGPASARVKIMARLFDYAVEQL